MKLLIKIIFVCVLGSFVGNAQGYTIPEIPKFQTSLYDYAKVLNPEEAQLLEEKLVRYSDTTTTQIVCITIDDLQGEDISQLATRWAHTWGVGDKVKDNGILILLAKNDRKIQIVNGYGIEDRITAGQTGEIIRTVIVPEFKAGSYYRGLDKGVDEIFNLLQGKYKGTRQANNDGDPGIFIILLIIVIIIIIIGISSKNGGNSGTGTFSGPDLADMIILSRMGRGGGGFFGGGSSGGGIFGGGGSSGGFGGGFGGGGFSGGGAGGSW